MNSRRIRAAIQGRTSLVLIVALSLVAAAGAQTKGRQPILSSGLSPDSIGVLISKPGAWHPFPRWADRAQWDSLPAIIRQAHILEGERYLGADWPNPKATEFLEFVRTGDRSGYQAVSFGRRKQLATLVLAECMEGEGRFVDDIVNGVWTLCEETYWGIPAHLGLQEKGSGLPDVTEPTVDLFAAETASLLAWTWYLLSEPLEKISPLVGERIRHEVERRVISVNLERDDFWWMGFDGWTNNWNPWICSNWLASVLILEDDADRRAQSVYKILRVLDNFLSLYPDDGGCDEGPGYWNRAGGSLFDCLELLSMASNGRIDHYADPLIGEMGRYIYRAHIAGPWFINFADAPAAPIIDAPTVYRYGRSIGDSTMMRFASFLARRQELGTGAVEGHFGVLGRVLPALFILDELGAVPPEEPNLKDVWLPGLQVMSARSAAGSAEGLFLAAKGGHNAESHNHNDVGNFLLYADGEPVIIDVGVETYTAKTFSDDRYSIWTMQSAFHNLPTINGVMQHEGREFHAREVSYSADAGAASLQLDIAGAYPAEAGATRWVRTITLNRGRSAVLYDQYAMEGPGANFQLTLMTARVPSLISSGVILLPPPPGSAAKGIKIAFEQAFFRAEIEEIPVEDPKLRGSWGEMIFRILLTAINPPAAGDYSIVFR